MTSSELSPLYLSPKYLDHSKLVNQGQFCPLPPGTFGEICRHFSLSQLGGAVSIQCVESRDAAPTHTTKNHLLLLHWWETDRTRMPKAPWLMGSKNHMGALIFLLCWLVAGPGAPTQFSDSRCLNDELQNTPSHPLPWEISHELEKSHPVREMRHFQEQKRAWFSPLLL